MAEPNPPNHAQVTTTNSRTDTQTNSTQNPDLLIIAIPRIKFNGQNYELWSHIMEMFIYLWQRQTWINHWRNHTVSTYRPNIQ